MTMFKPFKRKPAIGKDGKKLPPKKKRVFRKRPCKFCMEKAKTIDYLEYLKLQKFITERGKIMPSRISGNCAKHQRLMAAAIKKARVAALLPFVAE